MNSIANQKKLQNSAYIKKEWKKPQLTTIRAAELAEYIKAAARSGLCVGAWGR